MSSGSQGHPHFWWQLVPQPLTGSQGPVSTSIPREKQQGGWRRGPGVQMRVPLQAQLPVGTPPAQPTARRTRHPGPPARGLRQSCPSWHLCNAQQVPGGRGLRLKSRSWRSDNSGLQTTKHSRRGGAGRGDPPFFARCLFFFFQSSSEQSTPSPSSNPPSAARLSTADSQSRPAPLPAQADGVRGRLGP